MYCVDRTPRDNRQPPHVAAFSSSTGLFPPRFGLTCKAASRGFSVLELVVVLILIGILAAVILPRLPRGSDVAARAGRDDLLSALRFAQQLAMADATRTIRVVTTASSFSLTADNVPLPLPEGGGNYPRALPAEVTLSPVVTLTYDGLGQTNTVTTTMFTLTAADSWRACVEISGYARPC